jgi:ADP-ribosylglycohydrolase
MSHNVHLPRSQQEMLHKTHNQLVARKAACCKAVAAGNLLHCQQQEPQPRQRLAQLQTVLQKRQYQSHLEGHSKSSVNVDATFNIPKVLAMAIGQNNKG